MALAAACRVRYLPHQPSQPARASAAQITHIPNVSGRLRPVEMRLGLPPPHGTLT